MNAPPCYVMRTLCVFCLLLFSSSLWLSFAAFVMNTRGSRESANTSVGKRTSLTCSDAGCVRVATVDGFTVPETLTETKKKF